MVYFRHIKVNINEPFDQNYKQKVEDKTITHWISRTGLSLEQSYPKKVSYIKNTKNTKIGFYDYGTLIIESGSNLFSQFIKNLVKNITHNILDYEKNEVRHFMRGIIGGESCIEIDTTTKKFRVHISATDDEEKLIYHNCFNKLGIFSIIYKGDKLVISKKENNLELLKQKLMTLSPEKYNKFLRMIKLYEDFEGLKEWRSNLQKPWNKIPEEKINAVIGLHKEHPDWPAWKIAEQVCISNVKVSRVRKELEIDQNRQKLFK